MLRALDGELVLCVTDRMQAHVRQQGEVSDARRFAEREDPDFPGALSVPIPSAGETVVMRSKDELRMCWTLGAPSTFGNRLGQNVDSLYWSVFAASVLAHVSFVVVLGVQPQWFENRDVSFHKIAAMVRPQPVDFPKRKRTPVRLETAPSPVSPSLGSADNSQPRRSSPSRSGDAVTAGIARIGDALDSVLGESGGSLVAIAHAIRSRNGPKVAGSPRGMGSSLADAGSHRAGHSLGTGSFPVLSTLGKPPRAIGLPVRRRPVEISTPSICGGIGDDCALPRSVIRSVIEKNRNQIRACYERELHRRHGLQGRLLMRWVIGANGNVVAVETLSDSLASGRVARCVADRIRVWRFPEPTGGGTVEIHYPFVFQSH